MNKVEKAIIMAAGIGNRLRPLTDNVPKPLVDVNGKRMIDGIIEALIRRGIFDIIVVVGYLSERFVYLQQKYGIKLVDNVDYAIANNISSLYYARKDLDSNLIILDGDQIIVDDKVIKKRFLHSGYACWYSLAYSHEWMLSLNSNSSICKCDRNGGKKAWELKSLSYWTSDDARRLASLIEQEYEQGNSNVYWDDIAMFIHRDKFQLFGHKIEKNSIIEIDNLEELILQDKKYLYLKEKYNGK